MIERTIVAGLAATRLVRAWKYEVIGEKPREAVLDWADKPVMRKRRVLGQSRATDEVNVKATSAKEFVGELLDCPHCLGVYVSIGCAIGLRHRWMRPLIEGLAGAMILSTIVQWFPGFSFDEPDPPDPVHIVVDSE